MEVKTGYKQTEVGVIPEDWVVQPLGKIGKFKNGINKAKEEFGHGFPFVNLTDVFGIPTIDLTSNLGLINSTRIERDLYSLHQGDVLFVRSSVKPEGVGLTTIIQNDLPDTVFSGFLIRFRESGTFLLEYKKNCFNQDNFRKRLIASSTVSANTNINQDALKGLFFGYPQNITEQRAIATALFDADARIFSLDKVIAKKRDLKQAAMQELLTGRKRLPRFSEEWDLNHLGEVLIRVTNGSVYKPTNSFGLPITRIETISDGTISFDRVGYAEPTPELQKYKLERGDILFSHINSLDHIGKVAIFNGESELYHGMNLLLLRAGQSIIPEFLFYWLGSHQGRKRSRSLANQAVSQASINTNELKGIELRLPPIIEQRAIATVLSDMDAELAALEQQRDKTKAIKHGMMQELLTGRIRLV